MPVYLDTFVSVCVYHKPQDVVCIFCVDSTPRLKECLLSSPLH